MCGILCAFKLSRKTIPIMDILNPKLLQLIKNRGPDKFNQIITKNEEMLFIGSVLWHQGKEISIQPLQQNNGILIFNGDIFNMNQNIKVSDSIWLLTKLNECKNDDELLSVFQVIKGPYSFVYCKENENILYFGRDSLGRNSLVIENVDNEIIKISSVSQIPTLSSTKTIELPSVGIFKIDLNNTKKDVILYPWKNLNDEQRNSLHEIENTLHANVEISKSINPEWLTFSKTPSNAQGKFDFYDIVDETEMSDDSIFEKLIKNESVFETVNQLLELIEKSVKERVINTRKYCTECLKKFFEINSSNDDDNDTSINCVHGKIGILFSGGIDCSIIAALAHKFVNPSEPIDLINVAFESVSKQSNENCINWNVPDRISARESYEELAKLFPERIWNLVEINISRNELHEKLSNHICNLIYPLNTVLDESLGCAFWFGARGVGTVNNIPYKSNCRIILVGSGADELFGGYTRHRNSYQRCKGNHCDKLQSLKNELQMDWNRIPMRNLGRDDRVIADYGKTSRTPFIEEDVVNFVNNLEPSQKCCFKLIQGIGDKLLLRLCGYHLNLRNCTKLKKRAIQFGSKIANKKQNATDISKFLKPL